MRRPIEYNFLTPQRIVFGWGRRTEIGRWSRELGRRAYVIHGSRTLERNGILGQLMDALRAAEIDAIELGSITREPLVDDVDRVSAELRRHGADGNSDFIVGIGGGAALDLAKAASAMATNTQSETVKDYLEGVGIGLTLDADPLPMLALPTTAGTGSEATKNAVISQTAGISGREPAFKKSLRSDLMVPRIALVDPELSCTLPPTTTAFTGMDALTQLIESYISRRACPLPQALAIQGVKLAGAHLVDAVRAGDKRDARESMAHAALLSGLALANSGLGMAHGVAAALGIHCDVPHGLACAVMLPTALRTNQAVCAAELAFLGETLCARPFSSPDDACRACVEKVEEIAAAIGIPQRLGDLGVRSEHIADLVTGSRGNSMNGNPRELSDPELTGILEAML